MLHSAWTLAITIALQSAPAPTVQPPVDRPLTHLFQNLEEDGRTLPSSRTALVLGVGALSAIIVHPADTSVADWANRKGDSSYTDPGSVIGDAWVQGGAAMTTYAVGLLRHDTRITHLGADLIRGQALNGVITQGTKLIASRTRPNGGRHSFPSGHSSATFTTAAILQEHFGWRTGVPAYAVAGFVSWTRVRDDAHFLTDVLVGSAIGIAVGETVAHHHGEASSGWAVTPSASTKGFGLYVVRTPRR